MTFVRNTNVAANAMSRRELLKSMGVAAAVAAGLKLTIVGAAPSVTRWSRIADFDGKEAYVVIYTMTNRLAGATVNCGAI